MSENIFDWRFDTLGDMADELEGVPGRLKAREAGIRAGAQGSGRLVTY